MKTWVTSGQHPDRFAGSPGKVDVTVTMNGAPAEQVTIQASGNVNPPEVMTSGVGIGNGGW